mmetsp:Transcript_1702/g.3355  ORF Transcript_1702/g.3355 Transcript_1702/m.3355 type:complete len:244 (-) Transcript_1702:913-1644(-)
MFVRCTIRRQCRNQLWHQLLLVHPICHFVQFFEFLNRRIPTQRNHQFHNGLIAYMLHQRRQQILARLNIRQYDIGIAAHKSHNTRPPIVGEHCIQRRCLLNKIKQHIEEWIARIENRIQYLRNLTVDNLGCQIGIFQFHFLHASVRLKLLHSSRRRCLRRWWWRRWRWWNIKYIVFVIMITNNRWFLCSVIRIFVFSCIAALFFNLQIRQLWIDVMCIMRIIFEWRILQFRVMLSIIRMIRSV